MDDTISSRTYDKTEHVLKNLDVGLTAESDIKYFSTMLGIDSPRLHGDIEDCRPFYAREHEDVDVHRAFEKILSNHC